MDLFFHHRRVIKMNFSGRYFFIVSLIISLLLIATPSQAQNIPSPKEIIGFEPGADYHLLTYDQSLNYYKALAEATDMVQLEFIGNTSMGKPMMAVIISSSENMANLERYREISLKLAKVKELTDEQAKALAQEGKAIVYIDAGMHASEIAPVQTLPNLAYELVTSEEPYIKNIRENVIVILLNANPDGQTMIADWYHQNVGTEFELSPMPWLYNKYTGHDNNHDAHIMTQQEVLNKNIFIVKRWHPMIVYVNHQTAPFPARIYVYPSDDPINPNVDPLVIRWRNFLSDSMGLHLDYHGMPGTIALSPLYAPQGTWNGWDTWFVGYSDTFGDFFNCFTQMTETAGAGYATPKYYNVRDFPAWARDLRKSTLYASPWKGGWWRLSDSANYIKMASLAICEVADKYKEKMLYSVYLAGKNTIERFKNEPPFAYVVPAEQRDPITVAYMLSRFEPFDIEIYKAQEDFTVNGQKCQKGSYVIPMNQAYANYVKAVMEVQHYPEFYQWHGGPPNEPDEVVAWTFPYLFNVDIVAAEHPLKVKLERAEKVEPPPGAVIGRGNAAYILGHESNVSLKAVNRLMMLGAKISWAKKGFKARSENYPAGTIIINPQRVTVSKIKEIAEDLSLKFTAVGNVPSVPTLKLKPIRIGLYRSWVANMDEGYTRWLLEQYEFPFENLYDADIKAGNLLERCNVIVLPSRPNARPMSGMYGEERSSRIILHGHAPGRVPPQYAGGITELGTDNLRQFVEKGGTLVCLGTSCLFAIKQLNLPVVDSVLGLKPEEFSCPGSQVKIISDTNHPVAYGMEESCSGYFWNNSVFDLNPVAEGTEPAKIITKYAGDGLFMSGRLIGEEHMRGKAAIVEVPYGKGKVILHGFRVKFRGWTHSTFKLFFNSLYYGPSIN
jgi:hypothetical protein